MAGKHLAPKQKEKKQKRAKKPPRFTGKARVAYYAYITLTVISALVVLGYVVFSFMSAPPDVSTKNPEHTRPPSVVVTTQDPEGNEITVVVPGLSDDKKEQFYTFLLVGQSQETGGSLTDTMMLVSYDVPNQALSIMSLPRDTYVNYKGYNVLLNTIYTRAGGERGHDAAITALKREVSKLTGVYADYSVVVKWEAFGELVDAIGGVYYEVPRNMDYDDPTQDLHIHVKKGYQFLDGEKAMQVVRFREGANGYRDGDLGRIRTQQSFMKEVIKKCLQPDVLLKNLTEYISIFQKNVTTDLGVTDLTYFVKSAVNGLDMDNVNFVTLPYKDAGDGAHLLAVPEKVLEKVNQYFNPYIEDLTLGELDIVASLPPRATPKPTPTPAATPSPSETHSARETPKASAAPEPSHSQGGGEGPVLPPAAPTPAETEPPVVTPPPATPEPEGPILPGSET